MTAPCLIVLHQESSTPGRLGHALSQRGVPLDVRRPRYGDPLPDTLAEHSGAIIFGGPMSANDEDEFVRREIDWTAVPLAEKKPFLGICLGAQMLARQLGGKVCPHPHGHAEIGYYPGCNVCAGYRSTFTNGRIGRSRNQARLMASDLRRISSFPAASLFKRRPGTCSGGGARRRF
jgi:anthranilate/para-aminobenzoate synthase component II